MVLDVDLSVTVVTVATRMVTLKGWRLCNLLWSATHMLSSPRSRKTLATTQRVAIVRNPGASKNTVNAIRVAWPAPTAVSAMDARIVKTI